MITGVVKIDNDFIQGVTIFESDQQGTPLKRNNKYTTTLSNNKGEYSINVTKDQNFYLTFKFVGTKQQTINTLNIPAIVNLISDNILTEFEITAKKTYKWLWLLLLIPIIYKLSKNKK
jgi:plasmid maintenance system killer protein